MNLIGKSYLIDWSFALYSPRRGPYTGPCFYIHPLTPITGVIMVLVTRQAPDFTAAAVLGSGEIVENFNLKKHLNGKPAVLFSGQWTSPSYALPS